MDTNTVLENEKKDRERKKFTVFFPVEGTVFYLFQNYPLEYPPKVCDFFEFAPENNRFSCFIAKRCTEEEIFLTIFHLRVPLKNNVHSCKEIFSVSQNKNPGEQRIHRQGFCDE